MRLLALSALIVLAGFAAAEGPKLAAVRLASPPTIDGTVDAAEWQAVTPVEGGFDPRTGEKNPERSQFWIAYDADYLYFAARLDDASPSTIRAVEYRTNVDMPGDDRLSLNIDVSGVQTEWNEFELNPRGATNLDLAGGRAAKREWAGEFVAKARITATGWEAEARVPWQLMRLPGAGKRDLRFNFGRYISRTQRYYEYTYTGNGKPEDTPTWVGVELPKPVVDRSIKLLPFTYAGDHPDAGLIFNSGLDLKTQLSDRITAVGSINPDFRNIENQILSLDFSRFERLADETRPFFQEGRDYLETPLFASQRIRSFDVGFQAYGKIGDKAGFGLLNAIDFTRENSFIGTFGYNPTQTSNVGAAFSSYNTAGRDNNAYALSAGKGYGNLFTFATTMASHDTYDGTGYAHDLGMFYSRNGTNVWASANYMDRRFNPGLGFFPERDSMGFGAGLNMRRTFNGGPLRTHNVYFNVNSHRRTDGRFYREGVSFGTFGNLRSRIGLGVNASWGSFEQSKDNTYGFSVNYPDNDPFRSIGFGVTRGKIDGTNYELDSWGGQYRIIRGFDVSLNHQRYRLGESDEQSILGLTYDLGRDRSISGRAVRRGDDTNWYLSFRKSGNRGVEYYMIVGDPNARSFQSSIILKVVAPFELGGKGGKPVLRAL